MYDGFDALHRGRGGGLGVVWYSRSIAQADDEAGPAWVPVGEGWWCYSTTLRTDDGGFKQTTCTRTKQSCAADAEDTRIKAIKAGFKFDRSELRCTSTKKVVGFTFHYVVQDDTFGRYFPRVQDCQESRDKRADADHDQVSGCMIVGDVAPSVFDDELVPEGKGWHCAVIRGINVCQRLKEDCAKHISDARAKDAVATNCTAQSSAFALTTRGRMFAFGTQTVCNEHMQDFPDASSCKKI